MEKEPLGETSDGAELFQVFQLQISGIKPTPATPACGAGLLLAKPEARAYSPIAGSDAASIGRENKPQVKTLRCKRNLEVPVMLQFDKLEHWQSVAILDIRMLHR